MRAGFVLGLALLLAACGKSEDFTVEVPMGPGLAKAELARLDGGMVVRALSLAPVRSDASQKGELVFFLKGDAGEGDLRIRFQEEGTNGTRMHVSLTLPAAEMTVDGARKVLSESTAERLLQASLKSWADGHRQYGYAPIEPLDQALGGLVLALTPDKMREVMAAAGNPGKLAGIIDPGILAELGGESGFGSDRIAEASGDADMAEPMMDPDEDAFEAEPVEDGAPMDLAQGTEPTADLDPDANDW